jgi:predicted nucleic acid-binding protein
VIDYIQRNLPPAGKEFVSVFVNQTPLLSVVSKIELLRFDRPNENTIFQAFVNYAVVYPLDEATVEATIQVCKGRKIKLPDAVIAATCLVHGMTLVSRNIKDFKNIEGLTVINPWDL